jgi:hypothetical protein
MDERKCKVFGLERKTWGAVFHNLLNGYGFINHAVLVGQPESDVQGRICATGTCEKEQVSSLARSTSEESAPPVPAMPEAR